MDNKEIHIYLYPPMVCEFHNKNVCISYLDTITAIKNKQKIIDTFQTHFCSSVLWKLGYEIIIHFSVNKMIRIEKDENNNKNLELLLYQRKFGDF